MGKSTINGPFSIAMLNYQRVTTVMDQVFKATYNPRGLSYEVVLFIATDVSCPANGWRLGWFAALGLQYLLVYIGLYPKTCVLVECVGIGLTEILPGIPFVWVSKPMVSH